MDDATRLPEDRLPDDGEVDVALAEVVGELTHVVLGVFRSRGFGIAEQLAAVRRDPLEVLEVFALTLHGLADGLVDPSSEWLEG
ncbi:MAG: hypothetical protein WD598_08080 [Acidimicrobiia bacterium]